MTQEKTDPDQFVDLHRRAEDASQRQPADLDELSPDEGLANQVEKRSWVLHRQAAELEALVNVSSALRHAVTIEETISILIKETVNAFEAESAAILLLADGALVVAGLSGPPRNLLGQRYLPGDDPWWQVVNTGQPILVNSVEHAELAANQISQHLTFDMATLAIIPLQAADETLGLLQITFSQPDRSLERYGRPLTAIGEMGGSALHRVKTTETLEQLVRDRMRDVATLYDVTTTTTQHLDTHIILERVLDKALEAIGGDVGIIHLLDEVGETLRMAVQRGMPARLINRVQALPLSDSLWGQVVERKETVVVPNLSDDPATPQALYPEEYPAYIGVPISSTGRALGAFSVFGETIQKFSAEDIALLAAIANHIGVAIESAQLRQRAEEAAVMEERQRLARELHDSVTQSLYSLTLFAEAAQDSARAADLTQVKRYLSRVSETAQQALKGMRWLIYELHPLALTQEGLVGALRQRLEAVERRAGVETQLLVETPLEVPASLEAGLYRIAQEALNNVLKHAAATRVTVRLGSGDAGLQLEVMDNGKGFDPQAVGDQAGIGLASMQERVENLGGSLQIVSRLGQGTSIRVVIPWAGSG
jgi:signal transduction histidine kinase